MEFKKLIIEILDTLNILENEIESIEDGQLINHLAEMNSLTNISTITDSFNELLKIESFGNEHSEMLIQNLVQNNCYRFENIKKITMKIQLVNMLNSKPWEIYRLSSGDSLIIPL